MEGYRHAHLAHTRAGHLTKLYSDTKKDVITSINFNSFIPTQQANPEKFASLQRKLRIQKDRYLAWGLAWSDDETGPDGNIDESVANAGLTEIVASIMGNVQEVIHELESGRSEGVVRKAGEKITEPATLDERRYEDLLQDLTASNDTLYDLSRSRRALARGEHPAFGADQDRQSQPPPRKPTPASKSIHKPSSIAESELTLVSPMPFLRPSLSPYAGLPPRIEASALHLPHEKPPPYESIGVPIANRLVGHLLRSKIPESVQDALGSSAAEVPVLIEYASYDATYKDTGVPPPLQRLEALATALQPMRPESQHNISLLGYFEDPLEPRIGLVYDLPYSVQNRLHSTAVHEAEALVPSSLLSLIRKSRPAQTTQPECEPPPLELRFKLALHLAEQLYALHQRGLPHGNVNSSSIVFASTSNQSSSRRLKQLGSPIWASFDVFSKCSVEGQRKAYNLNIYRHPDDHSYHADRDVAEDIRFDLYSLALVLLEIGLWQSLGDLYKAKYSLEDFKVRLEKLWAPKLASKCGTPYMRAVQTCLRAVDSSEISGMTTSGIYEAVLLPLRKCCLLVDDTEEHADASDVSAYLHELSMRAGRHSTQPLTQASTAAALQRTLSTLARPSGALDAQSSTPSLIPSLSETSAQSQPQRVSSFKGNFTRHLPNTPSLQDYGRKVSLIQQKWREHSKACMNAGTEPIHSTAQPSVPQGDEQVGSTELPGATKSDESQRTKPKLKEFPMIDIPQPVKDEWNNKTAVELARLVNKALKGSRESCSINLTSYGETPETARPTYLVTCASTKIVKQILKRHFHCDPKACYVRVEKGKITRCRKSRGESAAQSAFRSMAPRYDQDLDAVNPDYQPQPMCGASIGAYKDEAHLPPVSFGGIINVDGRSYGMSVHHMLESDEAEDELGEEDDTDSDTSSILSMSDSSEPLDSEDDSTVRQQSAPSELSLDEDCQTDGDAAGVLPGEGEEISITQPALDDAISLNLHADEEDNSDGEDSGVDEDHILSYKLGQIHASSGLKRTSTHSTESGYRGISGSLPQEIDWALFELLPPRIHPFNVIRGGRKFCDSQVGSGKDCFPFAIKDSAELAGARVHCLGRTSGLASGVISSTMELLKLHGRSTFAASWTVHGGFGVGGDSGAWVVSSDGKVCGHVLAERAGRTYICPMELLVEDIRTTLGADRVALPVRCETYKAEPVKVVGEYVKEEEEEEEEDESVEEAVAKMRLEDSGGVALPYSLPKARKSKLQFEPEREKFVCSFEPLSSAG